MVKPRQEFLGAITRLAEDGSGVIDGYGAEIHNVTMVLNECATTPVTGIGKGAFWSIDNIPKFTDSNGYTINLGSDNSQKGSGTVTLVDGYADVVTIIPEGAKILWSIAQIGGIQGSIQITNQTTSGFRLLSTSKYDTSVLNWFCVLTVPEPTNPISAYGSNYIQSYSPSNTVSLVSSSNWYPLTGLTWIAGSSLLTSTSTTGTITVETATEYNISCSVILSNVNGLSAFNSTIAIFKNGNLLLSSAPDILQAQSILNNLPNNIFNLSGNFLLSINDVIDIRINSSSSSVIVNVISATINVSAVGVGTGSAAPISVFGSNYIQAYSPSNTVTFTDFGSWYGLNGLTWVPGESNYTTTSTTGTITINKTTEYKIDCFLIVANDGYDLFSVGAAIFKNGSILLNGATYILKARMLSNDLTRVCISLTGIFPLTADDVLDIRMNSGSSNVTANILSANFVVTSVGIGAGTLSTSSYGSNYIQAYSPSNTVSLVSSSNWYPLTGLTWIAGDSRSTTTSTAGTITINSNAEYRIECFLTLANNSSNLFPISAAIYKNGNALLNSAVDMLQPQTISNNLPRNVVRLSGVFSLNSGDIIDIRLNSSYSGAVVNIIAANIVAIAVGVSFVNNNIFNKTFISQRNDVTNLDTNIVTYSGKNPEAHHILSNDGLNNIWTDRPKLTALSIANGTFIGPNNGIRFDTLPAIIGFYNTTGGPGNNLTISAQNSKVTGGNINLNSGFGETPGVINIQIGGKNSIIVGQGYLRNNVCLQQTELDSFNASNDAHVIQGYDGRIAAKLPNDFGSYTIVPKTYQLDEFSPRHDKQFGGFRITNEESKILSFSSTILDSKMPPNRKMIGTFLIGYSRENGPGSSALYLLDAASDCVGKLTVCSLTTMIQKHNGNDSDVLINAYVSSDSTFDIEIIKPNHLEFFNYYWELNYGWA